MIDAADVADVRARLRGELCFRAVVIEPRHRREVARVEALRVLARDQRVRVRGVADDEDLHAPICDGVERFALRREDLRVRLQQVLALHAGAARPRADEQAVVDVLEGDVGLVRDDDAVQRLERAVVELHRDAVQRAERRRDLEQLQDDRLICSEQLPRRDAKCQLVSDLTCGARDCDANGRLALLLHG